MPEIDERLAALFGRAPAPPRSPAPAAPDFFAALARAGAAAPPISAPAPLLIPEVIRAPRPSSTIDVREAATEALAKTGYFETPPETETDAGAPAPSPFSFQERAVPSADGLFRGLSLAGKKKKPATPPAERPAVKAGAASLKDLFGLEAEPVINKNTRIADAQRRAGVKESFELKRILKIDRRPPARDTAPDMSDEFRRSDGKMRLWPIQSAALYEGQKSDGLFAPVGVGGGKTLIALLLAAAMRSRQAVILVPPGLRSQLIDVDIPRYARDWKLPLDRIRIVAYSQLSNARSHDILEAIKPDVIIADEVHNLRHRSAARTKRFLRYMKEHPTCRFAGMSGTITRKSIKDYQHLVELALKKNSPLPQDFGTLCEWAEALDVVLDGDAPMAPGALLQLCSDEELDGVIKIVGAGALNGNGLCAPDAYEKGGGGGPTIDQAIEVQTIVRSAFRRRLVETAGVVATEEGAVESSLNITALRPLVPAEVQKAINDVRVKWALDGDEFVDALRVAQIARQLASGFRYRWMWPKNPRYRDPSGSGATAAALAEAGPALRPDGTPEPRELIDDEWILARKEWFKEVREILKLSRKGMDSPLLIAQACERNEYQSEHYEAWRRVKGRKPPPIETIWTSQFLVNDAIAFAREHGSKANPLIIWYSWDCIGRMIAARSAEGGAAPFPFFGPGKEASQALTQVDASKTPVIVCSIAAHGTGKNLQAFTQSLVTTPPSGGVEWEQLLGRLHRPGQLADEVQFYCYAHTIETEGAFRNAVKEAQYIEATTGQRQKLNYATKTGFVGNSGSAADAFTFRRDENPETAGIEWTSTENLAALFGRAPG